MKTFPMFLTMAGRRVAIFGGGEQGAQKVRLFARTEARIDVYAPDLCDELAEQAAAGRITHHSGRITAAAFEGAALVVIGTGCCMNDRVLHLLAKDHGALTNVVDRPALCDAITPSIVDRDPVVVAIGTEGTAPVLGRQIKTRVEEMLAPDLGNLAALIGGLRNEVAQVFGPRARRDFYRWVFGGAPGRAFAKGNAAEAEAMIRGAIARGAWEEQATASLSVVEAALGASDLITLRGVQRMQEADVIFAAPGLETYLELARRDAEREVLDTADAVQAAQADGQRVVCLVPVGAGATLAADWDAELVASS